MHALVPMRVCRPSLSQLLLLTEAGVIAVAYARRSLRKLQSCRSDWPSRHQCGGPDVSGQVDLMGVAPCGAGPGQDLRGVDRAPLAVRICLRA